MLAAYNYCFSRPDLIIADFTSIGLNIKNQTKQPNKVLHVMRISDFRGSRIQPLTLIKTKTISLKPIKTVNWDYS